MRTYAIYIDQIDQEHFVTFVKANYTFEAEDRVTASDGELSDIRCSRVFAKAIPTPDEVLRFGADYNPDYDCQQCGMRGGH